MEPHGRRHNHMQWLIAALMPDMDAAVDYLMAAWGLDGNPEPRTDESDSSAQRYMRTRKTSRRQRGRK